MLLKKLYHNSLYCTKKVKLYEIFHNLIIGMSSSIITSVFLYKKWVYIHILVETPAPPKNTMLLLSFKI